MIFMKRVLFYRSVRSSGCGNDKIDQKLQSRKKRSQKLQSYLANGFLLKRTASLFLSLFFQPFVTVPRSSATVGSNEPVTSCGWSQEQQQDVPDTSLAPEAAVEEVKPEAKAEAAEADAEDSSAEEENADVKPEEPKVGHEKSKEQNVNSAILYLLRA